LQTAKTPIRDHPEGSIIDIRVHPSSSRRGLVGLAEGRLNVCVHAPPEKGKANREALKVLSDALSVPPSRIKVIRGHSSRNKTILMLGLPLAETSRRLGFPTA
jgi:uncharacterized protein